MTTEETRLPGREELCRILHDANTGRITPEATDTTRYGAMADAVLDRLRPSTPAPPVDGPFVATSSGTFRPGDRIEWNLSRSTSKRRRAPVSAASEPGIWEAGEVRSVDGGRIIIQLNGDDFAFRVEASDLRHMGR